MAKYNKTKYTKRKRKTLFQWLYGVGYYLDFSIYYKPKRKQRSGAIKYYHPYKNEWTDERYNNWYKDYKNTIKNSKISILPGVDNNEYVNKYKGDGWYFDYKHGSSSSWDKEFDEKFNK